VTASASIYDATQKMRQRISVVPDTEWVGEYRTISFEVPDEVDARFRNRSLPEEERAEAYIHILACAKVAIDSIMSRPDLAEMEIDLSKPMSRPKRDRIQETMEEIENRRANKLGLPSITALMKANKVNYVIDVYARRKKRLFIRFPDELGPQDGFEAMSDLPEDIRPHAEHVYDEGRPQ